MTAFTGEQAAAIISLRHAFPGEKLVVIGSVGLGCHLPNAWRRTNDIDLTLAVDFNRFGLLRARSEWKADTNLEYRFTHENGLRVDLLPSAKRYLDEGVITFAHTGQVMNLTGFDLALQHTARPVDREPLALRRGARHRVRAGRRDVPERRKVDPARRERPRTSPIHRPRSPRKV